MSWRTSCSFWLPDTLTHIASSADAASFGVEPFGCLLVVVMDSPHTFRTPPAAWITACVMFWLHRLLGSASACVVQKPGVRQIAGPLHTGGSGSRSMHCPLAGSHTSQVGSAQITVVGFSHAPVAGTHRSVVQALLSLQVGVTVLPSRAGAASFRGTLTKRGNVVTMDTWRSAAPSAPAS